MLPSHSSYAPNLQSYKVNFWSNANKMCRKAWPQQPHHACNNAGAGVGHGLQRGEGACHSRMPDMLLQFARNVQRATSVCKAITPHNVTWSKYPDPSWELPSATGPTGVQRATHATAGAEAETSAEVARLVPRLPFVCHSICVAYGAVSIAVNVSASASVSVSLYASVSVSASWTMALV